jgi:hypothetical protein
LSITIWVARSVLPRNKSAVRLAVILRPLMTPCVKAGSVKRIKSFQHSNSMNQSTSTLYGWNSNDVSGIRTPDDVNDANRDQQWRRSMEALLTAIVVWLSANYDLPSSFEHPRVEFVSAKDITAHFYEGIARQQQAGMVLNQSEPDVVSLYSSETKTIYLLNGWKGKAPGELSMLVHEMVHHLQNVGQLKFACPQEKEKLAYKAQDGWLALFGSDLAQEFQIDPFSLLV